MNNEEKILGMLEKLTEDVSGLKADVSGLKADVSGLKADVSGLKENYSELRKDFEALKEDQAEIRETLTQVALVQENVVLPGLRRLEEGHTAILSVCAPKEQTEKHLESLDTDMFAVKEVVRSHSGRIAELEKKAQ